jgi:NAD(P)-dependent dehydrogenase (short-subunit alcohol dehydrogenase family)
MQDRTVIITGGNAGLGYQSAKNIAASDPAYHSCSRAGACRGAGPPPSH